MAYGAADYSSAASFGAAADSVESVPDEAGERVRDLRRERGWTQEDLEAKAKVERVFLSRLEGGRQNPSILTIRALARAFKIRSADLLPPAG